MTISAKTFDSHFEYKTVVSGCDGGEKALLNLPRPVISETVNNSNNASTSNNLSIDEVYQYLSFASPSSIIMSPTASSSPRCGTKPIQRNKHVSPRQYISASLSTDLSGDEGYFSPSNIKRCGNNYGQRRPNKCSELWSLDSSRLSSGSTCSRESGIFSGGNHNYQPPDRKPRLNISNDGRYRSSPFTNIRSGKFYGKIPPGTFTPTATTHFASSKYFAASAASILPQPPQQWLLTRTEQQLCFRDDESDNEREMAKLSNTFDFYNLQRLLTVGA